jgi:predicted nucleotidyltransferase
VILRDHLAAIVGRFDVVELAVMFGSTVRGTTRPDSDVDIGIRLTTDSTDARLEVERALARSVPERRLDIIDLDDAPPQLRFEIGRDGLVLVERRPYAWADFRARAMIDWWDWAPYARMIHRAAAERARQRNGPA